MSLDQTLNDFVARTVKSRIAVVIPLFGYWKDAKSDQLNAETLKLALDRVYSSVHSIYFIFVGDVTRMDTGVANIIAKYQKAGNCKGVAMKRGDTYSDHVREGFKVALTDTDAEFIVNVNPWILFQHNGLDMIIDRVNMDDVKVVCGYDIRGTIAPETFDQQVFTLPREDRELNFDFIAMKRLMAEMVAIDDNYKTHSFFPRDVWQGVYSKGFETISSQRIPIFTFEVDWKDLEAREDFEADKAYFIGKHRYDPDIKYDAS